MLAHASFVKAPAALLLLVLSQVRHAWSDAPHLTNRDYLAYNKGEYGEWPSQRYHSFNARSPLFLINHWDQNLASGKSHIFFSPAMGPQPRSPMIFDAKDLSLVYVDPSWDGGAATTMQYYHGEPYLTFWVGKDFHGHGTGWGIMLDNTYSLAHNLTVNGVEGGSDSHEFQLTDDGGALINNYHTIYNQDVTVKGGPVDGKLLTNSFQEIDIATGEPRFTWNAIDHFGVSQSLNGDYNDDDWGWDWFHQNSLQKTPDGNYLISSRHLCTLALINGTDGSKIWQVGGVLNDFTDLSGGRATGFCFQHDARFVDEDWSEITLFDNHNMYINAITPACDHDCSRGMKIKLDYAAMTVTLVHEFYHPKSVQAWAEGGIQEVDGNFLVSYGVAPALVEFTADGLIALELQTRPWHVTTGRGTDMYRAFKFDWNATPTWDPSMVTNDDKLHVSWNGATEVAFWQISGGPTPDDMYPIKTVPRAGFETSIRLQTNSLYCKATALDRNGVPLRSSPAIAMHQQPSFPMFNYMSEEYAGTLRVFPFVWAVAVLGLLARSWGFI